MTTSIHDERPAAGRPGRAGGRPYLGNHAGVAVIVTRARTAAVSITAWRHSAPILVGILALAVSAAGSATPSLWRDEVATLQAARLPWTKLLVLISHVDVVHATYYEFMHFWITVAGDSQFALRLPSAVGIGVAAALTVVLGRMIASDRVGVMAGVVFAVLPRVTYMGAEARSYGIATALAVLITIVFLRGVRSGQRWIWMAYALLSTVSAYLFAYLLLMIVVHGAFLINLRSGRGVWVPWLAASLVTTILTVPLLVVAWAQKSQLDWLAGAPVLNLWALFVEQWFDNSWATAIVGWGILSALAWRFGRMNKVHPEWNISVPLLWFVAPTVIVLLANVVAGPLYTARYLSFCSPAVSLLIGMACAQFNSRKLGWLLIALMVLSAIPNYLAQRGVNGKPGGSDLAQIAQTIAINAKPGDAIVFEPVGTNPRLALEGYRTDFRGLSDIELALPYTENRTLHDSTNTLEKVAARLDGIRTVWVVTSRSSPLPHDTADLAVLQKSGFGIVQRISLHVDYVYELRVIRSRVETHTVLSVVTSGLAPLSRAPSRRIRSDPWSGPRRPAGTQYL